MLNKILVIFLFWFFFGTSLEKHWRRKVTLRSRLCHKQSREEPKALVLPQASHLMQWTAATATLQPVCKVVYSTPLVCFDFKWVSIFTESNFAVRGFKSSQPVCYSSPPHLSPHCYRGMKGLDRILSQGDVTLMSQVHHLTAPSFTIMK